VSRSGYYYYLRNQNTRAEKDRSSLQVVREFFEKSRGKGGIRTIDMMIRNSKNKPINHKKIRRLKNEYGLITRIRRKNPYKNLPTSENAVVPNILKRDFLTPLPDQIYSTDMTYLIYGTGEKAYLSATKDLNTNEIVSYKVMKTPSISVFVKEFSQFLTKLDPKIRNALIIHSDQGFQYTHESYRNLLKDLGVTQSMSRRANCYDNAPIESFFGHFKDLIDLKKCQTYEELNNEVKVVIDYYNYERPQKALNKKAPAYYRGLINSFF
jgi:putative transposase